MAKNELLSPEEVKRKKQLALSVWEDCIPDLTKKSVYLQKKALDRIDKTIDDCNASQAAKVFATLYDRIGTLVGEQSSEKTTNNFYFTDISDADATALMEKVLKRHADARKMEEVEVVDVDPSPAKDEEA